MNIEFENDTRLVSQKKPTFPINELLSGYLNKFNRATKNAVSYSDLLRFQGCITVYDKNEEDTLWVRCYYADHDRIHIDRDLKKVYDTLYSDGNEDNLDYLSIDAVDFLHFW